MSFSKRVSVVAVLLLASGGAWAYFKTGNELLANCTGNSFKEGYCLGYIASVSDTHNTWVDLGNMSEIFCLPKGVTQGQLQSVGVKYLEENPADLHLTASSLIAHALGRAFPCN
jgi:hypothetical protein